MLPLKYFNQMIACCQFGNPQQARTLMPIGTGGEDGDSAVSRRGRLHIAGRIGNGRMPDGKLQVRD